MNTHVSNSLYIDRQELYSSTRRQPTSYRVLTYRSQQYTVPVRTYSTKTSTKKGIMSFYGKQEVRASFSSMKSCTTLERTHSSTSNGNGKSPFNIDYYDEY